MGILLTAVRAMLIEIIDRIDSGNCATTDEQEQMFLSLCEMVTHKERFVSKYDACRYIGVSRATFDRMVFAGKMPKGEKRTGWKELAWRISDLDAAARYNKKNNVNY